MNTRYAVYLAPPPESALWRFGCRVLGRDAATGVALEGFAPEGFEPDAWLALTAEPRRYGFHATLKAPFRLKVGRSRDDLEAAVARLAASTAAFNLGPLQVSALSMAGRVFVALTPVRAPPALFALEARAVCELDDFRAPPNDAELKRRNPERLSQRQRDNLDRWGYAYVLDEFRLHFTLTGVVANRRQVGDALAEAFSVCGADEAFRVDAIALFVQEGGSDFRIARRFALG